MRKAFYHVYKVRYVLLAALMVLYLVLFLSVNTGMANASDYGQDTSGINIEYTESSVILPFDEFEGFDVCVEGFSEESPISYVALTGGKIALINNEIERMDDSEIFASEINDRFGVFGAIALPGTRLSFIRWENAVGDVVSENIYFCPKTVYSDSPNVYYAVFETIPNASDAGYQSEFSATLSEDVKSETATETLTEFDNLENEDISYDDSTYLPNATEESSYETEEPYWYGYYDNQNTDNITDQEYPNDNLQEVISKDYLLDNENEFDQTNVPNQPYELLEEINTSVTNEFNEIETYQDAQSESGLKADETYSAPQINSLDTDSVDSGVMTLQTDVDAFIPVPCGVEMNVVREIIIIAATLTFVAFVIVERFGRRRYGC